MLVLKGEILWSLDLMFVKEQRDKVHLNWSRRYTLKLLTETCVQRRCETNFSRQCTVYHEMSKLVRERWNLSQNESWPTYFGFWLAYAASRDKNERDQFHEVVLHGETLVFSPLRPLRAVAEVESGSTFRETGLATEVRKSFTNRPCYTVQRLLKLVSQRRCTQVSAKRFNV